ncbi:hypothetical protein SELMODRAFT_142613 [Selaginella moellendorffii]|uniref:Protein disulfide-isomerase n=1 Tax=Selaginella moellendorffii TaxID=88036 RepID=D8R0G0_SELML|nr:protein disulfide-isomerase [Selaginella moellendorffii]EFJ34965.1 hypothetical protein SELMODRAFT_142613 [Selaginella moellendorffii]|eukprot:XP_002964632.1 protein disulfide-isomerase [Selaginella moellendorffii]
MAREGVVFLALALLAVTAARVIDASSESSDVLELDDSNFADEIKKHDFIVVEFYAPWCGHCKKLAPEYEKAATALKEHNIVLAKVDANEEKNKKIASDYEIRGFPTLKIIRKGTVEEYKGPRDADGIVSYLKKQAGPATVELTSTEEAGDFVGQNKIAIIGVFKSYDSEEFQNFTALAEALRSEYDFRHTLDASVLPLKDEPLKAPAVRLFKVFDERFNDFTNFYVEELKKFVEESSLPLVTELNQDPEMQPFLMKFFNKEAPKVFLFVESSHDEEYRPAYKKVAESNKPKGLLFLAANSAGNDHALQHFGLAAAKLPSIVVQDAQGKKFAVETIESSKLSSFVDDYLAGKLKPWVKSEPVPEKNDEPVKVVVRNTLNDLVIESGKDVLLEFYAPWCGHCKKLAPTLDEVAEHFKDDPKVVIAKLDATANDIEDETFDVQGFPTLYLYTGAKQAVKYEGDRSKEDLISFVDKHRTSAAPSATPDAGEPSKDEL